MNPTFAEYDRHLRELDEAAAIWLKTAVKESDPAAHALCLQMATRAKDYAATLRDVLAYYRSKRIPVRPVLLASDRN